MFIVWVLIILSVIQGFAGENEVALYSVVSAIFWMMLHDRESKKASD